jgi:hypothetical protein
MRKSKAGPTPPETLRDPRRPLAKSPPCNRRRISLIWGGLPNLPGAPAAQRRFSKESPELFPLHRGIERTGCKRYG